jgi:hypothetical protein
MSESSGEIKPRFFITLYFLGQKSVCWLIALVLPIISGQFWDNSITLPKIRHKWLSWWTVGYLRYIKCHIFLEWNCVVYASNYLIYTRKVIGEPHLDGDRVVKSRMSLKKFFQGQKIWNFLSICNSQQIRPFDSEGSAFSIFIVYFYFMGKFRRPFLRWSILFAEEELFAVQFRLPQKIIVIRTFSSGLVVREFPPLTFHCW